MVILFFNIKCLLHFLTNKCRLGVHKRHISKTLRWSPAVLPHNPLGVTDIDTVIDFHNIANCVVKEQWLLSAKTKDSTTQTVTKDSTFITCQSSTWVTMCKRVEWQNETKKSDIRTDVLTMKHCQKSHHVKKFLQQNTWK